MIGAIIGDIAGSIYEFNNHRSKEFTLIKEDCFFTDDTVMTLALAKAITMSKDNDGKIDTDLLSDNAVRCMQEVGRPYPYCGYGGHFGEWIYDDDPQPYNSYGNGAAMRISACVEAACDIGEAKALAKAVTVVTHNHPEGLKGAEATVVATFMAKEGRKKEEIRSVIEEEYYNLDFTLDEIRDTYEFNETCQGTVPQALVAFLESESFEDAIRNAISVGGDSDTLAAITGTVAEAYYGVPVSIRNCAMTFLDDRLIEIYEEFQEFKGVDYVTESELENGIIEYTMFLYKMGYIGDRNPSYFNKFIGTFRDAIVKVPGKPVISDDDRTKLFDAIKQGEGATFSNEEPIMFEPDIITKDNGSTWLPMFSSEEQVPDEYLEGMNLLSMPATWCLETARKKGLDGIVLDPFKYALPMIIEMAEFVEKKESHIRYGKDNRWTQKSIKFDVSNEEFDEILKALEIEK